MYMISLYMNNCKLHFLFIFEHVHLKINLLIDCTFQLRSLTSIRRFLFNTAPTTLVSVFILISLYMNNCKLHFLFIFEHVHLKINLLIDCTFQLRSLTSIRRFLFNTAPTTLVSVFILSSNCNMFFLE